MVFSLWKQKTFRLIFERFRFKCLVSKSRSAPTVQCSFFFRLSGTGTSGRDRSPSVAT